MSETSLARHRLNKSKLFLYLWFNKGTIKGFSVTLLIDSREKRNQKDRKYIYEEIQKNSINVEITTLPVGDFLWVADF